VRLQISDLDRSIDYYERVLGLRAVSRSSGTASLAAAGRVLVELVERRGARPWPRRGALGLFHFAVLLPDRMSLGRFLRNALALGAISGLADHAVSEAAYLSDPDGLGIEVYADRPRSEWRVRPGGELYMTTEALNVEDLIAAGGSQPWEEAPAGTRMGHVHLHVGDLDTAESFYHRTLGFDRTVWTYPGALFFAAGGYHHHLGTNVWARGESAADDQARLLSWNLETADPDRVGRHLIEAGHSVQHTDGGWVLADPWKTAMRIRPLDV
jgi:catechol 2,3-dioxygenase